MTDTHQIIRAAAQVLIDPILRLLQDDPHSWSERPCQTCLAIGSIAGRQFGCYAYAEMRRRQRETANKNSGSVKP